MVGVPQARMESMMTLGGNNVPYFKVVGALPLQADNLLQQGRVQVWYRVEYCTSRTSGS